MPELRLARADDKPAIRDLYLAAFPPAERQLVAGLATELLDVAAEPDELDGLTFALLALDGDRLVGHIGFSPATRAGDGCRASLLAPLAVHPDFQRMGVGAKLIESGVRRLTECQTDVVFVYGDPDYYRRFGFDAELADRFEAPYPLQFPFGWQARSLSDAARLPERGQMACISPLAKPELW